MEKVQIINDIEVSCSYQVLNLLDETSVKAILFPGDSTLTWIPYLLAKTTLTIVRDATTYTWNDPAQFPTFTLSVIFGPRQYKQMDTASTILSEDDLKAYTAAGGGPDDSIARLREFVQEKARLGGKAN